MITRGEWAEAAEREAAKVHGRRHATFYSARHYAPAYLALAAIAAAGYGVWWLWQQVQAHLGAAGTDTLPGAVAHSGAPIWPWVAGAVLLIGTVVAFRPGHINRLGVLLVKVLVLGVLWLLLAGYVISSALG